MTISKGKLWEIEADPSVTPVVTSSDTNTAHVASELVDSSTAAGSSSVLKLAPGDLLKTLGYEQTPDPVRGLQFSMDLGFVSIDGAAAVGFVSHVVARNRMWAGECLVAMNAAWVGDLYLGPKAHPNDGLLDVTHGTLDVRQRFLAAKRARLGTHLPHPNLTTRRVREFEYEFAKPTPVYADGVSIGRAKHLTLGLVPDAFAVLV